MDVVVDLVESIGLGPFWTSIIIILITSIIYLLKKYVDLKSKVETITAEYRIVQRAKIDDQLLRYAEAQIPALWRSYRLLYEGGITESLEANEFVTIITEADEAIEKPYTDYTHVINPQVSASIKKVRNVLDQYKYSPSKRAIKHFLDLELKERFYQLVKDAELAIKAQCIKIGD